MLNQAPPRAQQLGLPDFVKVPHLVQVLEETVVAVVLAESLGLFVVAIVVKVVVGVAVLLVVGPSGVHMCWNRDMTKHSLYNRIP